MERVHVTSTYLSPVIEVVLWFTFVSTLITVLVRLAIKQFIIKRRDVDDYLIVASTIFALAQSISLSISTTNGLGQISSDLQDGQEAVAFKAYYASQLLFLISLCLSRLSLTFYIQFLSPSSRDRLFARIIGGAILAWALSSFLLTAFQCHLPDPWTLSTTRCVDLAAVQQYVGILGIVTDIALIILPATIVLRLRAKTMKKLTVVGAFVARISVIAATIVQMAFATPALRSDEILLNLWVPVLCAQTAQFLSVLTASAIYLKPFLDVLETGFFHAGDLKRQQVSGYEYSPQNFSRASKYGSQFSAKAASLAQQVKSVTRVGQRDVIPLRDIPSRDEARTDYQANVETGNDQAWDATSRSRIVQTTTWSVEEARQSEHSHDSS